MSASVEVLEASVSHLSASQLDRLRALLVSELHAQEARAKESDSMARQLAGQLDPDSTIERELAEDAAARAREGVQDVQVALDRLAAGTYGLCQACNTPIPFERLEAIPHARLCVACPSRRSGRLR